MSLSVSVVIPTLNEARAIPGQLAALARLAGVFEIIVADGGSEDDTEACVRATPVRFLSSPRGRGPQLNAGARAARGDVLLFLHADVRLPADAISRIAGTLEDPATVGGAFTTRTVLDHPAPIRSTLVRLADLRSRYTRLPYGDQAIFARRNVFDAVGGFPEQPLFEDLEFSRRLRRAGRLRTLRQDVIVSGRRFAARPVYFALAMNVLPLLYRSGVDPAVLARAYGHVR